MTKNLVVINGKAGAGKDEFVQDCRQILGKENVQEVHSSDFAKFILKTQFGWDGEKTEKIRNILADLVELQEQSGVLIQVLIEYAKNLENFVLFYHERNPKEIQKIKDAMHENCPDVKVTTLFVERSCEDLEDDRWSVWQYAYDYTVDNNQGLSQLFEKASRFCKDLGYEEVKNNGK